MSETPPRTTASPYLLLWFSGAFVLGVMAVTLFGVGMTRADDTSVGICTDSDTSIGECLIATEQHRIERHLVTDGAVTLGAGALACLAGAAVATVAGNRRR